MDDGLLFSGYIIVGGTRTAVWLKASHSLEERKAILKRLDDVEDVLPKGWEPKEVILEPDTSPSRTGAVAAGSD